MLKNRIASLDDDSSALHLSDDDLEDEGFEQHFSVLADIGVESIAVRFSSFIGGLFIFFYFLQRSETNSIFLFPAFIGLVLAIYLGFSAWKGFSLISVARKRRRDFYK